MSEAQLKYKLELERLEMDDRKAERQARLQAEERRARLEAD